MKIYFFFLFAVLFITSCKEPEMIEPKIDLKGTMNITRTEVGFNIYSNTGQLILEYTKQNCDSLSLKTLDEIYQTAKEFYDREELKQEVKTRPVQS